MLKRFLRLLGKRTPASPERGNEIQLPERPPITSKHFETRKPLNIIIAKNKAISMLTKNLPPQSVIKMSKVKKVAKRFGLNPENLAIDLSKHHEMVIKE
tara:strand:+ start:347 stop:643 length:297 start_codon:yes stop_codon:yes gene_type:complete